MVYIAQQAFGFGEVDPNIRAQYESEPYRFGCMSLENALIGETGSVSKRWGSILDGNYQASTVGNSYEYTSGSGDTFLIYGLSSTYVIKGDSHPLQTFSGIIVNVASRGPDLIVLTGSGIFRHEFSKSSTGYGSIRYDVELDSSLITTTPPVSIQTSGNTGDVTLTTNSSWFTPDDTGGDVYRLVSLETSNGITSPSRDHSGLWLALKENGYISPTQHTATIEFGATTTGTLSETQDWTGPYSNWLPVGKALANYTPASTTGITTGALWGRLSTFLITGNVGLNITPDGRVGALYVSTSLDSDHVSALDVGKVGKFVETVNESGAMLVSTWYFYVTWAPSDSYPIPAGLGAVNTVPLIEYWPDQDNPTVTRSGGMPTGDAVLQMYLASSDEVLADGLPKAKFGFYPSVLVRSKQPKWIQPVPGGFYIEEFVSYISELVGSPASTVEINTTTVAFTATGLVDSSSVAASNVRKNVPVGPVPTSEIPIDNGTMRIGSWEVGEWNGRTGTPSFAGVAYKNDYHEISAVNGPGPSSYWTLQSKAFKEPNRLADGKAILSANELEIHQERTFMAGFQSNSVTIDNLPEASDLPLTVMASKSGELTNFSTGSLSGEGFSFIISSKESGDVCWMRSQFNQLFIGTTEEEFVVTDVPMEPEAINIQIQSAYGSAKNIESVIFNQDILFVGKDGRSLRSISFQDRRKRYESVDMFRFARHLLKTETISRVVRVKSPFERLFVVTNSGKLYCFSALDENGVYGWSHWKNSSLSYDDILATVDGSNNPALWARATLTKTDASTVSKGFYSLSDPTYTNRRMDLIEEHTGADIVNTGALAGVINISDDLLGKEVSYILVVSEELYYGNATVVTIPGGSPSSGIYFGGQEFGTVLGTTPTKVYIGLPYTFSMIPNIPEMSLPGKGSTSGRNKNISRVRVYFNAARGGVVEGNSILTATDGLSLVPDSPGFYSVSVIGEYGPQPEINISQSVPYEFEVSGFNAEYDYGD